MIYVAVGVAGFLFAYIFDWASLKQLWRIKLLVGLLAVVLLGYATIMVCITPTKLDLPIFVLPIGILILITAAFLLIYSLLIEIPFRATYTEKGISNKLITSGTYALVRHPGVLWLALLYIALVLLFPSMTIFIATIVWLIMDLFYIVLQDKIFFPRMFPEYTSYQKLTPFIIPNRRSISACLKSLRLRKNAALSNKKP
jgi:protein-S-isoprenylcysteine O-methyltransferase Ste14